MPAHVARHASCQAEEAIASSTRTSDSRVARTRREGGDFAAVAQAFVGAASMHGTRRRGGGRTGMVGSGMKMRVAGCVCVIASLACVRGMSYQGELQLPHTDGGLFGSVTDGTEAWFGVDGYPAKVVRIRLGYIFVFVRVCVCVCMCVHACFYVCIYTYILTGRDETVGSSYVCIYM